MRRLCVSEEAERAQWVELEWEKERDRKALSIPPAVWGNSVDR